MRRERPGTSRGGFLLKSLLAAMAIFGVPLLLLAPGVSGGPSYDAGLYTMLAGALNLHHVVLDSVIWKLRNTRIANMLGLCALTVPTGMPGCGVSAIAAPGAEPRLLRLGAAMEHALACPPATLADTAPA